MHGSVAAGHKKAVIGVPQMHDGVALWRLAWIASAFAFDWRCCPATRCGDELSARYAA